MSGSARHYCGPYFNSATPPTPCYCHQTISPPWIRKGNSNTLNRGPGELKNTFGEQNSNSGHTSGQKMSQKQRRNWSDDSHPHERIFLVMFLFLLLLIILVIRIIIQIATINNRKTSLGASVCSFQVKVKCFCCPDEWKKGCQANLLTTVNRITANVSFLVQEISITFPLTSMGILRLCT